MTARRPKRTRARALYVHLADAERAMLDSLAADAATRARRPVPVARVVRDLIVDKFHDTRADREDSPARDKTLEDLANEDRIGKG